MSDKDNVGGTAGSRPELASPPSDKPDAQAPLSSQAGVPDAVPPPPPAGDAGGAGGANGNGNSGGSDALPPPPPPPSTSLPPPPPPPPILPPQTGGPTHDHRERLIFKRDLDEVYLLLDFVSGRAERTIDGLAIPDPDDSNAQRQWGAGKVVQEVMKIRYPPQGAREDVARQAAILLMAKDRLSRLAVPARSDTIAYTAMYVDKEGSESIYRRIARRHRTKIAKKRDKAAHIANPRTAETEECTYYRDRSLVHLAREAFPHFEDHVSRFRFLRKVLWWGGLVVFIATALTSWDVAHGRDVLSRIDTLQRDWENVVQANASLANPKTCDDYRKIQSLLEQTGQAGGIAPANNARGTAAGSNPSTPPQGASSNGATGTVKTQPEQGTPDDDVKWLACARLVAIETSKKQARIDLDHVFGCNQGSCIARLHILHWVWPFYAQEGSTTFSLWGSLVKRPNAPPAAGPSSGKPATHVDLQSASSVVTVFTGYVLPLLFGLLGTVIGAFRSIQNKVRNSELNPRDYGLTIVGAFLGMGAGLVIGIFMNAGSIPPPGSGNALGNVTLSAAGLAFIAGYASQSFFRFLDDVIEKVFPSDSPTPPPPPTPAVPRPAGGQP